MDVRAWVDGCAAPYVKQQPRDAIGCSARGRETSESSVGFFTCHPVETSREDESHAPRAGEQMR